MKVYILPPVGHDVPGRHCDLIGDKEQKDFSHSEDLRLPQFRREVFHRFYTFHLKYKTHPGCVYFLLPALAESLDLNVEDRFESAFVNGNTQNPVTTWLLMKDGKRNYEKFFRDRYSRLAFDTDRRYHKKEFLKAVRHYRKEVGGTQYDFFNRLAEQSWRQIFKTVRGFHSFGRLSTWSYLEYLRIIGLPIEPSDLMLTDLDGSKSHRNGLARVLGRDDLDWHGSNPTGFSGDYSEAVMEWLEEEAQTLLSEARLRAKGKPWEADVNFFTLESALCTYKSWHRPNRRYPNVYSDMLVERIRLAESHWPNEDFTWLWEARQKHLPNHLRLEDNPTDPGLNPDKQNHYLLTGRPVMMSIDWSDFKNPFDSKVWSHRKVKL